MIFVTVGLHEQPFNRLIEKIDKLKSDGTITEEVVVQTGYSTYLPKCCTYSAFFPCEKMREYFHDAHIVITHGGPSSFMEALREGKIPVVVPRQKKYREHVNDHQLAFCREIVRRKSGIILVEDVEMLGETLIRYDKTATAMKAELPDNNKEFNRAFSALVNGLFG